MHPAVLRFWRYFSRQGKGILTALDQCLNDIEKEETEAVAEARAAAIKFPTPKLSPEDLEAIEKIVKVTVHENGRK